jgi:hypothetical protein
MLTPPAMSRSEKTGALQAVLRSNAYGFQTLAAPTCTPCHFNRVKPSHRFR